MATMIKTKDPDQLHDSSDAFTHHAERVAEHRESYGSTGIRRSSDEVCRHVECQRFQDSAVSSPLIM